MTSYKPGFKRKPISVAVAVAIMGGSAPAFAVAPACLIGNNLVVSSTLDTAVDYSDELLTLREAIEANVSCNNVEDISFDASLDGNTIHLDNSISIYGSNTVNISAPESATITIAPSATNTSTPLLSINEGGTANIDNLVFDGESMARLSPLIQVSGITTSFSISNSEIKNSAANPSALNISDAGEAIIDKTSFSGNTADWGGAILSEDTDVTITDSTFSNNSAGYPGSGSAGGGAIYIEAYGDRTFSIDGTFFDSNLSSASNSGSAHGGAIAISAAGGGSEPHFDISNSTFSNNAVSSESTTRYGGAIDLDGSAGIVNIENSLFDGNNAGNTMYGSGGAISQRNTASTINIINTTLVNNEAYFGGALYNGVANESGVNFIQSTISSNSATQGGMVYMGPSSNISIRQSTVTLNSATSGNVLYGSTEYNMHLACDHSVIGDNDVGDDLPNDSFPGFTISDNDCYIADDAKLGDLTNKVHMPDSDSPLVDSGNTEYTPYEDTDQLGATRIRGAAIDIGAVETDNQAPTSDLSIIDVELTIGVNGPLDLVTLAGISDDDDIIIFDTDLSSLPSGISVTADGQLTIDTDVDSGIVDEIPVGGYYAFDLSFSDAYNTAQTLTIQANVNLAPTSTLSIVELDLIDGTNGPFDLVTLAGIDDDNNIVVFDTDLNSLPNGISVTADGELSIDFATASGVADEISQDGYYDFELSYSDGTNVSQTLTVRVTENEEPTSTKSTVDIELTTGVNGPFDLVDLAGISDDDGTIIFDTDLSGLPNGITLTADGQLSVNVDVDQSVAEEIPGGDYYAANLTYSDGKNAQQTLTIHAYAKDTDGDGIADHEDDDIHTPVSTSTDDTPLTTTSNGGGGNNGLLSLIGLALITLRRRLFK